MRREPPWWEHALVIDQAVEAAVAVAARYGLRAAPEVLQDGANALVRIGPVVARVATETGRARSGGREWIERDMRVARHVAARGVLAARPAVDPPAGPHSHGGFTLAFWDFVPHSPSTSVDPVTFAGELATLHDALLGLDLSDSRGPVGDLTALLPGLDVPDRLRAEALALGAAVSQFPIRPLHGDAHPGNVLVTAAGLVWNDFEDAWQGPLGWDLACLRVTGRLDGEAAVRAYPGAFDEEELEVCTRFRELYATLWVAFRGQRSAEWQGEAQRRLAEWRD